MLAGEHVFPTRVGMNRCIDYRDGGKIGVPHSRGDEPLEHPKERWVLVCSPLAWG